YGYPADNMQGRDVWQLVDVEDKTDLTQFRNALRVLQERGSWCGRVKARRRDGKTFWAELCLNELAREGGALAGYCVTVRDLSAEIEREQPASRAAKLAQVGTLLSNTAHELNNPIASIGNFIHLMLATPERDEDDRQMLSLMNRVAERLGGSVADLRTMVRKEEDASGERGPVDRQ